MFDFAASLAECRNSPARPWRAPRTGLRSVHAWVAALAAGLALTLAATDAWAQSCTTNAAPTVNTSSVNITAKLVCVDPRDCKTLGLPANNLKSTTFTGAFSDPGDTLTYSVALDESSTALMPALKDLYVNTAGDPGEEEDRLHIRTKPRTELFDMTPAVPNPLDFLVKITATDGCNSAHVYSKWQTLWRHVQTLSIVSRGPYSTGDTIQVRVTFARPVTVATETDDDKKQRLRIDLGGSSGQRWATYNGNAGGPFKQLTFEYTVTATDESAAGVAVVRNSLEKGKGFAAIRVGGIGLTNDQLIHVGLAPDRRHRVGSGGVVLTPIPGTLVSNLGQEASAGFRVLQNLSTKLAQGFRTGGNTGGYKLTRVVLPMTISGRGPDFTVGIYTQQTSNTPGTRLGTLSLQGSLASGNNTFTAPGGIDLAANTNYFVVADVTGTTNPSNYKWIARTLNLAEDPGAAAGWSIDNISANGTVASSPVWGTTRTSNSQDIILYAAIHGYVKGATTAPGATTVPDAPGQPTVASVSGSADSLKVDWSPPANEGSSSVTDYDLRYCDQNTDAACAGKWIEEGRSSGIPSNGTCTTTSGTTTCTATISGLKAGTGYRVQVRAGSTAGESAWSATGTATTGTASGSNNAPVLLNFNAHSGNTNDCTVNTGTVSDTVGVAPDTLISNRRSLLHVTHNNTTFPPDTRKWPSVCNATSSSADVPFFHDFDEDDLKLSVAVTSFPDNVRLMNLPGGPAYPQIDTESGRVFMRAVAIGTQADMTATVTATDPSGASRSMNVTYQVRIFPGRGAKPRFDEPVGALRFAHNQAGSAVLPPATGGDTSVFAGREIPNPYLYEVSGLPPGLEFDQATRRIHGTPTTAGTWTVTYTADDADANCSCRENPRPQDTADAVTQTFTIVVEPTSGARPTIDLVRVVSAPTHDSANNNIFDTYVAGDRILVDVEYSEPVVVNGSYENVRMRLDIGDDDTVLTNSRQTAELDSILHGGRTLRFAYTVRAGPGTRTCTSNPRASDCDPDGVWVQVNASNQVLFLTKGATIKSTATGVDADRTRTGLPTAGGELEGAERSKVDGGRTGVDGPVPETATIDGATLRVDFDKALDTSVNTGSLLYYLAVHGAGDVSGGHRNAYQHPDRIWFDNGNKTLVLTIMNPARAGQKVRLSYSSRTLLKGTGNSPAPRFRDLAVTNVTTGLPSEAELLRASLTGMGMTLTFDRAMDESSVPPGNAFRVLTQDFDGDTRAIWGRSVGIDGDTVTVALAAAVRPDELASVSYTWPASNRLRDAAHLTEVQSFSGFRVETVADVTPPTHSRTLFTRDPEAGTRTLAYIYFDEALDTSSVPAPADFTITCCTNDQVADFNVTPFGITVTNNAVKMELPSDSTANTTEWKFAYTPGTNPIRDLAGNAAAAIAELDVTARSNGKPRVAAGGTKVDGALLTLEIRPEPLDPGSVPDPSAFTLHDTDTDSTQLSSGIESVLRLESHFVYLRLEHPVRPCDGETPMRIKYTKPTGSNATPLQGIDGQDMDSVTPRNVTNKRHSQCRDGRNWLSHMTIGSVVIRANRPFATDRAPKPEWFTVSASGGPVTVTGAAFDPNDAHVLKLELSREFAAGETVTASYRRPVGESGLWDVDGNQLGDVTDWPVRAKAGLTASFHGLPETHDGRKLFAFEIRFSEEFQGMRLTALKRALQVTGGRLIDVKRTVRGENRRVTARVRPSQTGDVTLSLPATTDCSAADAICMQDGRKLSAVSASVPGPDSAAVLPVLSVADARAAEGSNLGFAVTLDPAATEEITVDYATSDGTATSGADYTAATGTLTFAAGETSKTVSVPLLRDADTEADETLTLTLSGASGATIGTASATGTVANAAPPADTVPPAPQSAEVDGHIATVTFDEDLAPASAQWFNFQWTITGTGAQHHPDSAWIADERTVKLRLAQNFPAVAGQTVMLKYEPSDYLRDAAGNQVAFFTMEAENLTLPVLTVDDARASEGTDATLDFTVRMNAAVEGTVTVDYATSDGTAKAGEDYTAQSGTLTFAPGDTEKMVSVPILDDALDEGNETFKLRLSNAGGARIGDGEATGTIENSDPLQTMWLSRFGRTVADHVAGAVSDRLSSPMTGAQVTVGGQNLDLANMEDEAWLDRTMLSMARVLGVPEGPSPGDDGWPGTDLYMHESPTFGSAPVRSITGREILLGSSFHLAGDSGNGGGGGTGMTAWGRVTTGGFDGEAPADGGNVRIDGEVTTGILGADTKWGRVLAGVALSVSEGEGSFDQPGVDSGTIESTMTTGSPYARINLNDRISAWGMAGLGTGDMTIVQKANTTTNQPERITRTDLSLRMAAVGGRGALMQAGASGGMDLALRADAFLVQTESEAVSGEGSTKADASRMRLILEGSRAFRTGNGVLTPGLELGLRHDGGDAETGTGVELGGRITYANPETGLSLEANVRALVAHEDSNYEEWGASGALRLVPGARGRGLSFSLAPTYGAPGSGVEQLWSARDAGGLGSGGSTFDPESRIEGEIGYGLPAFGDRYTGTPNLGFGLSDGGSREYRLGWRLARANGSSSGSFGSFALSLDATRSEPADNNDSGSGTAPEHAIVLRAGVRW